MKLTQGLTQDMSSPCSGATAKKKHAAKATMGFLTAKGTGHVNPLTSTYLETGDKAEKQTERANTKQKKGIWLNSRLSEIGTIVTQHEAVEFAL